MVDTNQTADEIMPVLTDESKQIEVDLLDDYHLNLMRHREAMRRLRALRNDVHRIERENISCAVFLFVVVCGILIYSFARHPRNYGCNGTLSDVSNRLHFSIRVNDHLSPRVSIGTRF